MLNANVKDNFQGQSQGLTVQEQEQGLGQLASSQGRVLEDSISDVHKCVLHSILYTNPPLIKNYD